MANKYYQRSYRAERKAFKKLENAGYRCIRASSSKGPADIIAISKEHVRLIEVKVKDSYKNIKKSVDEKILKELEVPEYVSREVWYWILNEGWRIVQF